MKKSQLISLFLISGALLTSCAGHRVHEASPVEETASMSEVSDFFKDLLNQKERKIEITQSVVQTSSSPKKIRPEVKKTKVKIHAPVKVTKKVKEIVKRPALQVKTSARFNLKYKDRHFKHWIKYFTGKKSRRDRFIRHLKNGARYERIVKETLRDHGLPEQLYYVGLIESGYINHARSHASAVGPWQFMKGTAKQYGLRVGGGIDERKSIYKSTVAAANYFKDLYNIFGSWELALCAYNAGEFRVIRAIRKGNTRDYRVLVSKKLLPKETIYYVPKVAAAMNLAENPKHYKMPRVESDSRFYDKVADVDLRQSFNLSQLAKQIGVSYRTLKKLNPDLNAKWVRSTRRRPTKVFVPAKFERRVAKIGNFKAPKSVASSATTHKVRSGENLSLIAKKYGTSIATIMKLNKLSSSKIMVGQRLKVKGSTRKVYTVRRGDNLTKIAKKFRTSIASIRKVNSLRNNKIYPRQKLYIPVNSNS